MEGNMLPNYLQRRYGNKGKDHGNFDVAEIIDEFNRDICGRNEEHGS